MTSPKILSLVEATMTRTVFAAVSARTRGTVRRPSITPKTADMSSAALAANIALDAVARAVAEDCLPADEREGWLRKCGVAS